MEFTRHVECDRFVSESRPRQASAIRGNFKHIIQELVTAVRRNNPSWETLMVTRRKNA